MIRMFFTFAFSAIGMLVGSMALPIIALGVVPVLTTLPRTVRIPAFLGSGLAFDLLSGHPFGTGMLSFAVIGFLSTRAERVLSDRYLSRVVFPIVAALMILVLLLSSRLIAATASGTAIAASAVIVAFATPAVGTSLVFGVVIATILVSGPVTKRMRRTLLFIA